MKVRPDNIERLLNGYIDGELSVRQQTEIKRLLKNDARLARRLSQLQKVKMLIGSLPPVEAPPGMVDEITTKLARRSLLGEEPAAVNEKAGLRELFFRKVLAVAAMVALVAVLGVVVYTIVAPPERMPGPGPFEPREVVFAKFNGRLELTTPSYMQMDASIYRAVSENSLVECTSHERLGKTTTYELTCRREGLNRLLKDLDKKWTRLDSATLIVETGVFGRGVAVDAVTPDQIAEIAAQRTSQSSIGLAKDFALVNSVTEQIRNSTILLEEDAGMITMPIPRLARTAKIEKPTVDKPNVRLVIVLE